MSVAIEVVELPKEVRPIEEKGLAIIPQAQAIKVTDEPSKELAGELFNTVNEALAEIGKIFNPLVESAKEAKRKADATRAAIVAQKEKFEEPWQKAKVYIVGQLTSYKALMDKKREEEQELLRQAAIKEEMERRKQAEAEAAKAAAELEAAGAKEEAAELLDQVIQENQEPIRPYVPLPSTPKTAIEGGTFRTVWKARLVNKKALCLAIGMGKASETLVDENIPNLNRLAVSLQGNLNIPGVEAYPDTNIAKARK